jgi:hypothetical protein
MVSISGGDGLEAKLRQLSKNLANANSVKIGFMSDATYPDGTSIAMVAAGNEFGGTFTVPEHEQTIYRLVNKAQTEFLRNGKFVKRLKANFASTHTVPTYTVTRPPRPFMRRAIAEHSGEWAGQVVRMLKAMDYDSRQALAGIGAVIKGEIEMSIRNFTDPALARSTVAKKGHDKPLVDSALMLRSVTYAVDDGSGEDAE